MRGSSTAFLSSLYRRVRGSTLFIVVILVFCVTWITTRWFLTWFDPNWGLYNTILSTEASMGTSWVLILVEKGDKMMGEVLATIQSLLKRNLALVEEMHAMVEELRDMRRRDTRG